MSERKTVSELTDPELTELYDRAESAERENQVALQDLADRLDRILAPTRAVHRD